MLLVTLPQSLAQQNGAGLQVVDYRSKSVTAVADANGVITATFPEVDTGYLWLVERITISTTSALPTQAVVYAGNPGPQNVVDSTASGNLDTADQASPIIIEPSIALTIRWSGATPGSVGVARIQYQLAARSV